MASTNHIEKPADALIHKNRGVRILAKSIFRELKGSGYDDKQIVAVATALLSEVTAQKRAKS